MINLSPETLQNAKLLLATGNALEFLRDCGFEVRISEDRVFSDEENIWIATTTVTTGNGGYFLSEGVSLGRGDRLTARCISVLESVERLVFSCVVNPERINKAMGRSCTDIVSASIFELYQISNNSVFKADTYNTIFPVLPLDSTGWALADNPEDACFRAHYEVIERYIRKDIRRLGLYFSKSEVTEDVDQAVSKMFRSRDFSPSSYIMDLGNEMYFSMNTILQKQTGRMFVGSAVGKNLSQAMSKSLDEVLVEYYFGIVANDSRVGLQSFIGEDIKIGANLNSSKHSDESIFTLYESIVGSGMCKVYSIGSQKFHHELFVAQFLR